MTEDDLIEAEASEAEYIAGVANGGISSISDDQAAQTKSTVDPDLDGDTDTKPKA
ncbi:hypothetical protein [Microbacterium sp. 4R-513]|uniref:hypothetical protein n=1 Tax=Microbacterium sp. 4R-513 TaxID=2567934 RepID=UPI001F49E8F9|nr:hypothetical protein [Microbacterium sp. 4R-513]